MQADAFKPQGREIRVVDVNGAARMAAARRMVPMPGAPSMSPLPMDPQSRGAAISSKHEVPRGAREVRLVTMGSPLGEQPPMLPPPVMIHNQQTIPVAPTPVQQAPVQQQQQQQPMMAQPRPFLQRQAPGIFRVLLQGVAPDGSKWEAPYDAEFPAGTQITGLTYAPLG